MKIFKKILIAVVGFIALLLIIALFVPKAYKIERSVTINRPKPEVFNYIKPIKNQDNYSVWNQADPNMHQESTGTDGTIGFINRWSGNDEVGVGEQEITGIDEGKRIDTELRFKEPFESAFNAYFVTMPESNDATIVSWIIEGKSPYPMNLMNPLMDGMMGEDLQKNLNNLKQILEN